MTFKAKVKLPKIELNVEGMKYVRQKAGEAIAPVVSDRVRAEWNESGQMADAVQYINGKVRPNSRQHKRPDGSRSGLNNYGLARVLVSRTGKDPFEVDSVIEAAGAAGAQEGLDELADAVLIWDGFGEEVDEP